MMEPCAGRFVSLIYTLRVATCACVVTGRRPRRSGGGRAGWEGQA